MKKIDTNLCKITISILLFILSFFLKNNQILYMITLLSSYILVSLEIYIQAFHNLKEKEFFDENLLMILATLGAFCIGEYVEGLIVVILFQIGEYLSDTISDHTKNNIIELMDLRCDTIHLVRDKKVETVSTKKAKVKDIFEVLPGEMIPLDGIIVRGESTLDTSSLTGESFPKFVSLKDKVLSGMLNLSGVLRIKATSTYETSTASKIIDMMEHSNDKKTKTEKFITRFSKIYTPIVVFLAIFIMIISLCIKVPFEKSLYAALVFLVMSCPCALVISVPLGFFQGIGRCSRESILVKGSNELDLLTSIDTVVFDKTGTITEGKFKVTEVCSKNKKVDLLKIAAHCESFSNHPIAKSIVDSYSKIIEKEKVSDFKEISGMGICANYDGTTYYLGNQNLMRQKKITITEKEENTTIIYIASENEYLGYIIIGDKIKDNAKQTISHLKKLKISNILMLSGDTEKMVSSVAEKVGITEYYHSLLPQDKVKKVEKLTENHKVMFVGDGMNDAPVIKASDIGISMGGIGSDIAIDASDIVLMNDDISKIPKMIRISYLTKKVIKGNIWIAILTKLVVLTLALFGISSIWMAILADVGVTLLSVFNTFIIRFKNL